MIEFLPQNEKTKYLIIFETRKIEFLAGRFAAKEAFSKAVGTGIGRELSFIDIEIESDSLGKPYIVKPEINGHLFLFRTAENMLLHRSVIKE